MKPRKPLKPGDEIKLVGWAVPNEAKNYPNYNDGIYWYKIVRIYDTKLTISHGGIEYSAHRRQVTHVKRKKKYVDRESLAKAWDSSIDEYSPIEEADDSPTFYQIISKLKQEGFEGF